MSGFAKFTMKVTKDFDGKGLDALKKRLEDAKGKVVRVGLPDTPHKNSKGEDTGLTNAKLGFVHEFGAPQMGIPERPFLRTAIQENLPKYSKVFEHSAKGLLNGSKRIDVALAAVGEVAAKDVYMTIKNGNFKPLKPATIKRKGSSTPLIDEGGMADSVTWEISND